MLEYWKVVYEKRTGKSIIPPFQYSIIPTVSDLSGVASAKTEANEVMLRLVAFPTPRLPFPDEAVEYRLHPIRKVTGIGRSHRHG